MIVGLPFKMIPVLPSMKDVKGFLYKSYIDLVGIFTLVMLFVMILQSFTIFWVVPTIFIICICLIKFHIFRENKDKMVKELSK